MIKILAVDNDPFILEFLKDILTGEGHEVLTAKDGLQAVDVLDVHTPDIIFVDLVMPNIDGKRLCKIIRAMRKLEDVYLVAFSATIKEERKNLDALGVDHCIAKGPFEEMTRDVLSAVNRRKRSPGIASAPEKPRESEPLAPKPIAEELFSIKKHFEIIFERMSEGIVEISADKRVIYANPAALSIIGVPEEKLLASPIAEIFPHEYRRTVLELISSTEGSPSSITEDILVSMNGYQLMVKALSVTNGGESSIIILNDVTMQKEAEAELDKSIQTLHRTLNGIIQAIALIVEIKDPYTAGHQRRVALLAQAIGKKLGFSKERIETLRISGLIHDIGKMAMPTSKRISTKMEGHARVGYEILNEVAFPWPVAEIVYQHHERMDGSGYPRGLSGNDILLEARILNVADVVEVTASHRPYRAAHGIPSALEEINREKGRLYDTEVVTACLDIFESGAFRFE